MITDKATPEQATVALDTLVENETWLLARLLMLNGLKNYFCAPFTTPERKSRQQLSDYQEYLGRCTLVQSVATAVADRLETKPLTDDQVARLRLVHSGFAPMSSDFTEEEVHLVQMLGEHDDFFALAAENLPLRLDVD